MQLFWSPRSPFARKVTIAAHELGLSERLERRPAVVTMTSVNAEVAACNPMVKLPTLILDDGSALYDSRVICAHLQTLSPDIRLFPTEEDGYWRALAWQSLGDGMLDFLLLWRAEHRRPEGTESPALLAAYALKLQAALDRLEAEPLRETPFGIGHIAIGCALGYLDFRWADLRHAPARDWRAGRPRLGAWFEEFSGRPSVAASPHLDQD